MHVYRIANCKFVHDLSGIGAALYGGRWNNKNTYVLYTAGSRAMALLESVVHIGKMPVTGFCMATIHIPDDSIETYPIHLLPNNWQLNPPPDNIKTIGDKFITENKYLALKLPSAILEEEHNFLLNPAHILFHKVKIIHERAITIDDRFFTA